MKKIIFLSSLLLITAISFSQRKGSFIVMGGAHYCQNKTVFNVYYTGDCPVGETYRIDVKQQGGRFFDAGFLYRRPVLWRTSFLIGAGINQKGFSETGKSRYWDERTFHDYTMQRTITYVSTSAGISFKLVKFKKLAISLNGLVNTEIRVHLDAPAYSSSGVFKRRAYSIRPFVDIEYKCYKNMSIHIIPFFQKALVDYNLDLTSYFPAMDRTYRPYSIGVSAGISF